MTQILPTYTCFDDALEYVDLRLHDPDGATARDTVTLVHGIATGQDGTRYAHGWVEEGDLCWDAGVIDGQKVYYSVIRAEYYAARGIQATTRYTVREACLENLRTGMYGPWRPEYQALCGRGDRRVLGAIAATTDQATEWRSS